MNNQRCEYCGGTRETARGWHDCRQAQDARRRLGAALAGIYALQIGGKEHLDDDLPDRTRLNDMATRLRIHGQRVRENY